MNDPRSQPNSSDDPFDSLLSLEQQYHTEGYQLGLSDGARAGRLEGRVFGTEKGFEKFLEMGRLAGRASIWDARLAGPVPEGGEAQGVKIHATDRVKKHVRRLKDLTDPETIATDNSEDAVSEFDDRLKDAKAKVKLISTLLGEDEDGVRKGGQTESNATSRSSKSVKGTGEMEDFVGLPNARKSKDG
ncbi:uncharacterized protein LTR77_004364 [Saxophila tyrrhenica]|uniref:Essential protein Yae1 N-terminal domain-containing protein n=1 Tax=Saxophila tyrrhenica TaxID=1690608 RepID=A0AAV9PFR2_9PEZI|nr:hypothetical protein LTR77_004364 [Saxophila tyrrhenica]